MRGYERRDIDRVALFAVKLKVDLSIFHIQCCVWPILNKTVTGGFMAVEGSTVKRGCVVYENHGHVY